MSPNGPGKEVRIGSKIFVSLAEKLSISSKS